MSNLSAIVNSIISKTNNNTRGVGSLAPHSGLLQDRKDFYFNTTASYLCKVSVQDEYMKVGDKVVEMYGEELVTNGDFSNGTTGWTVLTSNTCFVEDGRLRIESSSADRRISTPIITGIGKIYKVSCNIKTTDQYGGFLVGLTTFGAELQYRFGAITDWTNFEFVFTATSTIHYIQPIMGASNKPAYFDNISVREVKTIDLNTTNNRTGFYGSTSSSFVPEVLVQDQAVNGLNVTSGVKKGDYVVVKKQELGTPSIQYAKYSNNKKVKKSTLANKNILGYTVKIGANYYIATSNADQYGVFYINNDISEQGYTTVDVGSGWYEIQDIPLSVQLADDTYRAIQDTPSGTSLTNTTYFQTRDYVSNQVLTMLKNDGTLYSEVLMQDVYAEDIGSDRVFTNNGWSKVGYGLWSKGSVVGTPIGILQT